MSQIGIIAEFNPLHTGHLLLIEQAKLEGRVVCVLSGNFVQRGDTAIFEKQIRAKAALQSGCDLCIELPVCYSMSTAQNFAFGAVYQLNAIGCDTIMFGSECGSVEELTKISEILETDSFKEHLSAQLKKGITFAKARENAVKLCGGNTSILQGANNNLAIEYIIAAKKINAQLKFKTIKRVGANHDSNQLSEFVSASFLREKIKKNLFCETKQFFSKEVYKLFENAPYSDIKNIDNAILAVLRARKKEEFENLPDLSEGIENKLLSSIKLATNCEQLFENIKVKRYTLARIRRLVLSAFIGIDNSLFLKPPPYIRVLGFNKNGMKILKEKSKFSPIPIITKVSQISALSNTAKKLFETECRASDLYSLSLNPPAPCGIEFTRKIIKTE